jgi:hypothetical protein
MRELCFRAKPAMIKLMPAMPNTNNFCSERITMAGSQLNRLATTDPAPIITRAAGRAQHIRVLEQNSRASVASDRGALSKRTERLCR